MPDVTLDFETRSKVDLKIAGVHRYAQDASTDPICLCWKIDDEPQRYCWGEKRFGLSGYPTYTPTALFGLIDSDFTFHAWNAQFEYAIWKFCCVPKLGWPEPPPLSRWRCTMAMAAVAGYPQDLDTTSSLVGGVKKLAIGKDLIKNFCVPNKKGNFNNLSSFDMQEFIKYCHGDVEAERSVYHKVKGCMTEYEQKVWEHVALMNLRGLPVDIESVSKINDVLIKNKERMAAVVAVLTGGDIDKPTQTQRIVEYLNRLGVLVDNLQAATVANLLAEDDKNKHLPRNARRILEFRVLGGKSSTAKYTRMIRQVCDDGTLKGNLRYYGAGPGRHAGAGFQPQNLPRYKHKDPERVLNHFKTLDIETLSLFYNVEQAASGLIRHMIKAPAGYKLLVQDFSGIEAVAVLWMCQEWELIDLVNSGKKLYTIQASKMYHVPYEEVNDTQYLVGKILILACGYAGGYAVYMRMADMYGMEVTEEDAKAEVRLFRTSRPKLTKAWRDYEAAALLACSNPGEIFKVEDIPIWFQQLGDKLAMTLPSGRKIYYPEVQMELKLNRFGKMEYVIESKWMNSMTHKWEWRTMSGPLFFQNSIQGLCRDLLVDAQLRLEMYGYPQIGSVHDEAITLVREDAPGLGLEGMGYIMTRVPDWAEGFPLKVSGYEGKNYKKD